MELNQNKNRGKEGGLTVLIMREVPVLAADGTLQLLLCERQEHRQEHSCVSVQVKFKHSPNVHLHASTVTWLFSISEMKSQRFSYSRFPETVGIISVQLLDPKSSNTYHDRLAANVIINVTRRRKEGQKNLVVCFSSVKNQLTHQNVFL